MRSRSPVITDSDSDTSSWVTDDEVDAADAASWITDDDASSWTTDDEANDIAEDAAATETAASTTIRGGTTLSATRPAALVEPSTSNTARRLSYVSAALLLILAPLLLRRSADDQPAISVVSRVSLLLSSHHFFCIVSLSEIMGVFTVFRLVSHLPLLAFSVTRMLSPFAGMTLLYLNSICTAGLCGFALAERRRRGAGGEKPAAAVQSNGNRSDPAAPAKLVSFISLVCAVRVLWMYFSFGPEDALAAVFELSFMATGCLFSWTLFVEEYLLRCALFPGHTLGMIGTAGTMFLCMMVFTLAVLFGEAVAAIVPWLTAMATGGLLGYTLTVYRQGDNNASSFIQQVGNYVSVVISL